MDFMIDPPWPKKKGGLRSSRPNQGRELDYSTMSVPDIFDLLDAKIFPQAAGSHNVWLWCVDTFLHEAEASMAERGYRRHTRLVWNKLNGIAPAFTVRFTHEYLIWFYKPKLLPVAPEQRGRFTTVLQEKARQHSRKPDCAYAMVDALYPSSDKMDIFSREHREGWAQFGNEIDKFNS